MKRNFIVFGLLIFLFSCEKNHAPTIFGRIDGSSFYSGCTIPISGVTISVAGKSSTTGYDGKFAMEVVPIGTYTLEAKKTDYDPFFLEVAVSESTTTSISIPMTSQRFTSKVYGSVKDQEGMAISGAIVVILNPDNSYSELRTPTSATGYYQLSTVPQGERSIVVNKSQYFQFQSRIFIGELDYPFDIEMEKGENCIDPDGKNYSFVKIGTQTWMAENLAWLPTVSPSSGGSDTSPYYYVYGYEGSSVSVAKQTANYTTYGVLYNWPATMNGASSSTSVPSGVQGICPVGWHVPSNAEWIILTDYLGSSAGTKMKATSGWNSYGNGDNSSGFTALPGGIRNYGGGFGNLGYYANFWSSSENGSNAWNRLLYYYSVGVGRTNDNRRYGFSVRCLQDN